MENNFEHIEDIIAKFLAGEASPEEMKTLEAWKSAHPDHQKEFDQMSHLFSASAALKQNLDVDTDRAWRNVKKAIHTDKGKIIPLHKKNNLQWVMRIAAILILTGFLGSLIYFGVQPIAGTQQEIAAGDSIHSAILPDGSEITLNKHSSVQYATKGYSRKRVVKLKGEAFFDVKHDEQNPFTVETGSLVIQDIGTSFNVRTNESNGIVIVSVVSGEVKVQAAEDRSILLSAGEEASYHPDTRVFEKTEAMDKNVSAYKDKIFIFENAELSRVIRTLNDIYGSSLVLENEKLSECRITATFNNENIDDIANVIAETLGLTLQKENGAIIFKGNACN